MLNFYLLLSAGLAFMTLSATAQEFHIYNPPDGRCRDTKGRVYEAGMKWLEDTDCELRECVSVPGSEFNMEKYWKCPEEIEKDEEGGEDCHWIILLGHYPECCPKKVCMNTTKPGEFSFEDSDEGSGDDNGSGFDNDNDDEDFDDEDGSGIGIDENSEEPSPTSKETTEDKGSLSLPSEETKEEEGSLSSPSEETKEEEGSLSLPNEESKEDEGSLSLPSEEIDEDWIRIFKTSTRSPEYHKYSHEDSNEDSDSFEFNELPKFHNNF